jgi:hypothetical protein
MSLLVRRWLPFLAALALILGLGAFWQADRERRTDHVGNRAEGRAIEDPTGTKRGWSATVRFE